MSKSIDLNSFIIRITNRAIYLGAPTSFLSSFYYSFRGFKSERRWSHEKRHFVFNRDNFVNCSNFTIDIKN